MVRTFLACVGVLVIVVTFTPIAKWWAAQMAHPWDDAGGNTLIGCQEAVVAKDSSDTERIFAANTQFVRGKTVGSEECW